MSSTSYADRYPSYESPRADYNDNCVCVPYDQCLEVFRKEDGLLIDPRTAGGANIDALGPEEVVITDGNGTMIRVFKDSAKTKREDSDHKEENDDSLIVKDDEEDNSRKKREASDDSISEATENKSIKPVSTPSHLHVEYVKP